MRDEDVTVGYGYMIVADVIVSKYILECWLLVREWYNLPLALTKVSLNIQLQICLWLLSGHGGRRDWDVNGKETDCLFRFGRHLLRYIEEYQKWIKSCLAEWEVTCSLNTECGRMRVIQALTRRCLLQHFFWSLVRPWAIIFQFFFCTGPAFYFIFYITLVYCQFPDQPIQLQYRVIDYASSLKNSIGKHCEGD
jgi:hypothetical protein